MIDKNEAVFNSQIYKGNLNYASNPELKNAVNSNFPQGAKKRLSQMDSTENLNCK